MGTSIGPAKSRRLRRLLGQYVLGQGCFPGSTRLPSGLGQSPGGKRKRSSPPAAASNLKPTHKRGDTRIKRPLPQHRSCHCRAR